MNAPMNADHILPSSELAAIREWLAANPVTVQMRMKDANHRSELEHALRLHEAAVASQPG